MKKVLLVVLALGLMQQNCFGWSNSDWSNSGSEMKFREIEQDNKIFMESKNARCAICGEVFEKDKMYVFRNSSLPTENWVETSGNRVTWYAGTWNEELQKHENNSSGYHSSLPNKLIATCIKCQKEKKFEGAISTP